MIVYFWLSCPSVAIVLTCRGIYALAERVCVATQVYRDGLFNCDPHPGNILVHVEDGSATPVLLDFGMTKKLTDKSRLVCIVCIVCQHLLELVGGFLSALTSLCSCQLLSLPAFLIFSLLLLAIIFG